MKRLAAALVVVSSFGWVSSAHADLISPSQSACSQKSENDSCALPDGGSGACINHNVGPHHDRLNCEKTDAASASASATPASSATPGPSPQSSAASSGDNGLAPLPRGACGCRVADESNGNAISFATVSIVAGGLVVLRRRRVASR